MKLSLRGILAYLLAAAVFLIALIAAGVFDPRPVGQLQPSLPAASLTLAEPGQTIEWLAEPLPPANFSVRTTAVWQSGSPDSGVGLAVGGPEANFIAAVSPLGYVTIKQNGEPQLPWQPWPHVQPEAAENEIWLDVRGEEMTVWINRELLWQGSYLLSDSQLGLFGESFGETAVFTFSPIELFGE